jgi:hypothetical protein
VTNATALATTEPAGASGGGSASSAHSHIMNTLASSVAGQGEPRPLGYETSWARELAIQPSLLQSGPLRTSILFKANRLHARPGG